MKIYYVCRSRLRSRDANAVHVLHMTRALAALGHDVHVIALDEPYPEWDTASGPRWYSPDGDSKAYGFARIPLLARRVIRHAGHPDVIYTRHLPSAVFLRHWRIPFIIELHALHTGRIGRWIEALALRSSRVVRAITISHALRTDLLARYEFLTPDRVHVLHDAATVASNPVTPTLKRPRSTLQVGYVGSLYPGKGADLTIRLAARLPQFDFHIVGGNTAECADLTGGKLPPNLHAHGHCRHTDLAGIYASFDVGLVPIGVAVRDRDGNDIGRWTSPLKLFEYLAAGLAVVASDVPTLREVLEPDREALFAPAGDTDAWAEAIQALARDTDLRTSIAERGRQLVLRQHSWQKRARDAVSGLGELK